MAFNLPDNYRDMTQDELLTYLRNDPALQRRSVGRTLVGGEGAGPTYDYGDLRPIGMERAAQEGVNPEDVLPTGYTAGLTDIFDPSYEGGRYGRYIGDYDTEGNLLSDSVRFEQGQRHEGFVNENMEWLGPLLVALASAGGASGLFESALGTGSQAAGGVTQAALGELGVNTALSASELAANQTMAELLRTGVTEAALGELGINTALSASELAANQAAASALGATGTTAATGLTEAALGELGINTSLTASELAANQVAANALSSGVTAASLGELGINTALTAEQLAANQVAANALSTAGGLTATEAATAATTAANTANTATTAANTANTANTALTLSDAARVASVANAVGTLINSPIGGAAAGAALGAAGANGDGIAPQGLQSLVPEANPMRRVETGARGTGGRGSVRYFDFIPQDAPTPAPVGAARVYGRDGVEYSSPEAARRVGETNFTLNRPDMDPTATLPEDFGSIRAHDDPSNPTGPTFARGGAINQGLGYLRSSHDGMADKIAATIDGTQPAKLSGGEFVIPADVVSHLGNGNSDAGAKQLHEFLSRVRKARTGSTKQGRQINPSKFMPK